MNHVINQQEMEPLPPEDHAALAARMHQILEQMHATGYFGALSICEEDVKEAVLRAYYLTDYAADDEH